MSEQEHTSKNVLEDAHGWAEVGVVCGERKKRRQPFEPVRVGPATAL